jgi:deoxyxylulose-5-phosphate synthase
VAELLSDRGVPATLHRLGIPDLVVPHGDPEAQHEELGFGPAALRARIEAWIGPRDAARSTDAQGVSGARSEARPAR